jgi:hypothetical protein
MPTADEIERLVAEERWDEALAVLETSLQTALPRHFEGKGNIF